MVGTTEALIAHTTRIVSHLDADDASLGGTDGADANVGHGGLRLRWARDVSLADTDTICSRRAKGITRVTH